MNFTYQLNSGQMMDSSNIKKLKDVIAYADDFYDNLLLLDMINQCEDLKWLNSFPKLHIICQGLWLEAGHKGYVGDPKEFHRACLKHPDYYYEFCHKTFTDADWYFMFEHFPEILDSYEVRKIYPDVWAKFNVCNCGLNKSIYSGFSCSRTDCDMILKR